MKRKRKEDALQFGDHRCATMQAAIYVRLSTDSEGKSASCEEQVENCRDDARRFGFPNPKVYVEPEGQKGEWYWDDHQGRNPEPHRPALTELIDDAQASKIQAILVYKQDRLCRDPGVGDGLNKLFKKLGVRYICRGRDAEIDTARGMYQTSVDNAAARLWRDQISEDVARDLDYKFKRCEFTRNPSCFGWRSAGLKSKKVIPVYEEQQIVVRIFKMFLGIGQPALGPYQIARALEKEGVRIMTGSKGHKPKNPKKVHGSSIRQILQNSMHAGLWQHNGETKAYEKLLVTPPEGGEPTTVIPKALFNAANDKLSTVAPTGRKASGDQRMLSGLVVCGSCGRPMHVNSKLLGNGQKTRRWFCPRRSEPIRDCLGDAYATMVVEELDDWVVKHLAPYLAFEVSSMRAEADGGALDQELQALESSLIRAREAEVKALKGAILGLDEDQIATLAQELRADRLDIARRLQEVRQQIEIRSAQAKTDADLGSADQSTLKGSLRRFVRWIALSDSGVTVLTSLGTYVGAESIDRDLTQYGTADNRRRLVAPSAMAIAACPAWIRDPCGFVSGRRYALGGVSRRMTDEELLPGVWTDERELNAA